jgi:hypothetical protein
VPPEAIARIPKHAVERVLHPTPNARCGGVTIIANDVPTRRQREHPRGDLARAISLRQRSRGRTVGSAGRPPCIAPSAGTDHAARTLPRIAWDWASRATAPRRPATRGRRGRRERTLGSRCVGACVMSGVVCAAMRELSMARDAAAWCHLTPHLVACARAVRHGDRGDQRDVVPARAICYIRATARAQKRAIGARCRALP